MAEVIHNKHALVERPLKTSQATGATLAALGIAESIPLMHGSQGCSAFAKVYLIQHFREPVPLQNTAIDQVAAVMGADDNLASALALLCEKHRPSLILVMSTGLTEMQGSDIHSVIKVFQQDHPQFESTRIVAVNTPDFVGSMQTGFAACIDAIVKSLLPAKARKEGGRARITNQVNVLCSASLTPADLDLLHRYFEAFGLSPILLPDLSLSMDGHLSAGDFSPTSCGGTSIDQIEQMHRSAATIQIGESLGATGRWLEKQFGIPLHRFSSVMGLAETDRLLTLLSTLSGKPVPTRLEHARRRLLDAMLDTHFWLSGAKAAMALETDLAAGYVALLNEVGVTIPLVVTATKAANLKHWPAERVVIGDLSDLEKVLEEVELVIGNTHAANMCEAHDASRSIAVLRAGYPCHDRFSSIDTLQIGYEGARSRLFALADLLKAGHQDEVAAHISAYRFAPHAPSVKQGVG